MKTLSSALPLSIAAATLATSPTSTWAGDVSPYANGPWLGFSYLAAGTDAFGCSPADPNGLPCSLGVNSVAADAPAWVFSVGPLGATFEVVDVFSTGDLFEVFDAGTSLGQTSAAPFGDFCGPDPDGCVGTSASHGLFTLGPGAHSIAIKAVQSPFAAGVGYFRLAGDVSAPPPPPPPPDSDGDGFPDTIDACPASVLAPTVVIAGCNSRVANHLFGDGCTLSDRVLECGNGSKNHGVQVSCSAQLLDQLRAEGQLSRKDKDAIQSCVARGN